jgi:hypothetical protein
MKASILYIYYVQERLRAIVIVRFPWGCNTGVSEGVFDAMREWTEKGWGKNNAVKLRGGYGREVSVGLHRDD